MELHRLNKFIAASGICSRRQADELISSGRITVNGKTIRELGTKVTGKENIKLDGKTIQGDKPVYILLNKPKDYITTARDPGKRKTVISLVAPKVKERVFPVGRLDRNTTGVLLLTNDGKLAQKLTHPSYNKKKIYHVFLDKAVTNNDLKQISEGLELEDGFIQPDMIEFVDPGDKSQVGIEIHSGRNRIVRRIFESLGYRIKKLDRVYFAGLTKKGLSRGQWRYLGDKEIGKLKMNAYE